MDVAARIAELCPCLGHLPSIRGGAKISGWRQEELDLHTRRVDTKEGGKLRGGEN